MTDFARLETLVAKVGREDPYFNTPIDAASELLLSVPALLEVARAARAYFAAEDRHEQLTQSRDWQSIELEGLDPVKRLQDLRAAVDALEAGEKRHE